MYACFNTDKSYNTPFNSTEGETAMYLKQMPLTFEQVNELIAYDPETGSFTWKKKPSRGCNVGDECGLSYKGTRGGYRYRYINVLHYSTPAARVAWLLS